MEMRMSRKERDRLKVMEQLRKGQIGQPQAAQWLGLSVRQVRRVLRRYESHGDRGLIHQGRGRASNRRLAPKAVADAQALLESRYRDFGPTLAAEHLRDDDGLAVSRETVRGWMRALGLWGARRKGRPHRHRRPRRACLGELVQMDTSIHDWLEGRGPACVLITMIDDATGRKLMRFFEADTTQSNMGLIRRWIERHGRPLALYTDWAGHFKQAQRAGQKAVQTQIQRALGQMDIRLIAAHSPQAKGRVERSHATDQDRLIKELRLAGIGCLEAANEFVERVYLPRVNAKFAVAAASPLDAHREATGFDLDAILSVQETRRVNNDYTVQVDGVAWQIERGEITGGLRAGQVIVERRLDGSMRLRWGDRYLRYHRAPTTCRIAPQSVTEAEKIEAAKKGRKSPTPAGVGGAPLRAGSLRSPALHCAPPTPAIPKPRHQHTPSPDHPWKKRTFLLCRKPDIPTLR
jgi:transposase